MAKKKRGHRGFYWGLGIYAAVFLIAVVIGLAVLYTFLGAYENSRPQLATGGYLEALNPDYICEKSGDILSAVDQEIQSEEECREALGELVSGPYTCAKKLSECTDSQWVYTIRSGATVIGSVRIARQEQLAFGFSRWGVTGDEFDLSGLLSQPVSVEVPADYTVSVNGKALGDSHREETGIPFEALAEFSDNENLPTLVRYKAGPVLGKAEITIRDAKGEAVDPGATQEDFLNNCTQQELDDVTRATEGFLEAYVNYMSKRGDNTMGNLSALAGHLVPGGELLDRMRKAVDGLYWVSDRHASISDTQIHRISNLGGGRYLCDVTYTVSTRDYAGSMNAVSHLKLVFLQTDGGLKAELLQSI